MRYNYEDEAQDAIDGLDGEGEGKISSVLGLRHSSKTYSIIFFWYRDEVWWARAHGAVCQVRAQC